MPGTSILQTDTEVTNIGKSGFWIFVDDAEYFVPFDAYPDFKNATVAQILNVRRRRDGLYWPDLDVDIEIVALKHPELYPLTFKR